MFAHPLSLPPLLAPPVRLEELPTSMRADDLGDEDYQRLRAAERLPSARRLVAPGCVDVPGTETALGAVVGSSMVVTLFAPERALGGLCHFVLPQLVGHGSSVPPSGKGPSGLRGSPWFAPAALTALVAAFDGCSALRVSLYGGACPPWASDEQRATASQNLEVARAWLARRAIAIESEDVGGALARKLWFVTHTGETMLVKTTNIRRTDWFPTRT